MQRSEDRACALRRPMPTADGMDARGVSLRCGGGQAPVRQPPAAIGEAGLHHRTDAECEHERADTDRATHQESDGKGRGFDRRARQADAPAELVVQPHHQAVTRSGAEARRQIERAADADAGHAGQQHRALHPPALDLLRQQPQEEIHEGANGQRIEDSADAWPLFERNPEQQHDHAGDDAGRSHGDAELEAEALMERIPRAETEIGAHEQREPQAPQQEAREQHHPALRRDGDQGAHRAGLWVGGRGVNRGIDAIHVGRPST